MEEKDDTQKMLDFETDAYAAVRKYWYKKYQSWLDNAAETDDGGVLISMMLVMCKMAEKLEGIDTELFELHQTLKEVNGDE